MKITCPICPVVFQHAKEYILDIKEIFTQKFITERYYLHLLLSLVLTIPSVWFLREHADLADTPYWFQIFIGGFGAFCANFTREWYYARKGAPFSMTDIRMGSYGGILGTIILLYFSV
jgi:hypothetical protein